MRLISFEATEVHGYLKFDLKFDDEVTFLIGINGTGKTSVLKIILGLITPSYANLNEVEFKFARLVCWDNEQKTRVVIQCEKVDNEVLELQLLRADEIFGQNAFLKKSDDSESVSDENSTYQISRRNFESQNIIQEIKKMSTPIFLGLNRRIFDARRVENARTSMLHRRKYRKHHLSDPLNVSLIDLQNVLYDFYRQIAFQQQKINEQFRNQIISGSFEFVEESQLSSFRDLIVLSEKRDKVVKAIGHLNMEAFLPQINSFFDKMEEAQRQVREVQEDNRINKQSDERKIVREMEVLQKWFNNQPQLKRINDIIEISQAYQQRIEQLVEPVERTIKIINKFFQENNKRLIINGRGDISVELKNGNFSNVYDLSSGEKQIITIIGHLIFFEEQFQKEPGVFIIDEPELSLHLAWQQIFVSSLIEASPKTQLILATHSPSIIEQYEEFHCEDLAKMN